MGAIFEVHKELGPGFVESVYEKALLLELTTRGMKVDVEKIFGLTYKGKKLELTGLISSLRTKLWLN
jgi:GxxExxY protein